MLDVDLPLAEVRRRRNGYMRRYRAENRESYLAYMRDYWRRPDVMARKRETAALRAKTHPPDTTKNPAAVLLGRAGGKKGGIARAQKLSSKRRSQIARKAATSRWLNERKRSIPDGQ